ncbi:MAG: Gfo/Idh/MocA family oxidoreductase [Gammaproteobacteria bacterium]|nr:Gfo/Idh/MocA family oxidoreductase [Gammaproteobacteria bacterium]
MSGASEDASELEGNAEPIPVGLIGLGRWGRNLARTLLSSPYFDLRAIATRSEIRDAPRFREEADLPTSFLNARLVSSWRELLEDSSISALVVAVPPSTHYEILSACIRARVPVLVEKPLTLSLREADALVALRAHHNVTVMIDHTQLFSPGYLALRAALGDATIHDVRFEAGGWGPFRAGVPVSWDWGSHDVAMSIDLFGMPPIAAQCTVHDSKMIDGGLAQDIAIELGFGDGRTAFSHLSNMRESKTRKMVVELSDARFIYDEYYEAPLTRIALDGTQRVIDFEREPPLQAVLREFFNVLSGVSANHSTLELGRDVVAVLEKAAPLR